MTGRFDEFHVGRRLDADELHVLAVIAAGEEFALFPHDQAAGFGHLFAHHFFTGKLLAVVPEELHGRPRGSRGKFVA